MKNFLKDWGSIIVIVLVFAGLRLFVFTPVTVKGHSMDPTLADGQKLITLKQTQINRLDIITTKEPDDLKKIAVKRVIGLPGDTVSMKNDVLTVNGKEVNETYLSGFKEAFAKDKLQNEYAYDSRFQSMAQQAETFTNDFSYIVPENNYFVLGDNRIISKDSRIFGFIDKSLIEGEVVFRYWPFSKFSAIKS